MLIKIEFPGIQLGGRVRDRVQGVDVRDGARVRTHGADRPARARHGALQVLRQGAASPQGAADAVALRQLKRASSFLLRPRAVPASAVHSVAAAHRLFVIRFWFTKSFQLGFFFFFEKRNLQLRFTMTIARKCITILSTYITYFLLIQLTIDITRFTASQCDRRGTVSKEISRELLAIRDQYRSRSNRLVPRGGHCICCIDSHDADWERQRQRHCTPDAVSTAGGRWLARQPSEKRTRDRIEIAMNGAS